MGKKEKEKEKNLQIIERKLAWCAPVLVDEAACQVATKDGTEVALGDLIFEASVSNLRSFDGMEKPKKKKKKKKH